MRQLSFLIGAVAALTGLSSWGEAQQSSTLPANPTSQLDPLIPAPSDANVPSTNSTNIPISGEPITGTLPTTTIQSRRSIPNPNIKVTAERYHQMNGTTGSFRVNQERAKDMQQDALQKARQRKKLLEEMSSVRHYRMTYDSKSAMDYLADNPPHPNPPPISKPNGPPAPAGATGNVPANATYPGSRNAAPPKPEIEYIDMRKPGMGSLAEKIRASRPPRPAEPISETAAYNPANPEGDPTVGNTTAPTPPMPPTNVFRAATREPEFEAPATSAEKKKLFARFRSQSASVPEPQLPPEPPAEPTVMATSVSALPPEPAYPADNSVPTFANMASDPGIVDTPASSAVVSPPEKKTLFSMFGKKKSQLPEVNAPASSVAPENLPAPPTSFQPFTPREPKPMTSIFRPNASAKRANAYSIVQGEEVFANVDGAEVKLTEGTRVRVLREGSSRSLVRLYDNRQATIANSALLPETE